MNGRLPRRALAIGAGGAGLLLFAATLRAVDAAAILAGVWRVGGGFALILLLAGVRLAARAWAWTACAGGASRLPFTSALNACIVGDAAGNLTPLGLAASEPAKVVWVKQHIGAVEAAASLATETFIYSIVVVAMLVAGSVAWVAAVAPAALTRVIALLLASTLLAAAAWTRGRGRRQRRLSRALLWIEDSARGRAGLPAVAAGLRRTAEMLGQLMTRRPGTLGSVFLLQLLFQAAAVGEVWLTLLLLGVPGPTLLQSFLLEYANRVVTVAFKFVPMRVGVDELASAAMASVIGSTGTVGVTLAVVRKARMLCWTAVGVGIAAVGAAGPAPQPAALEAAARQDVTVR